MQVLQLPGSDQWAGKKSPISVISPTFPTDNTTASMWGGASSLFQDECKRGVDIIGKELDETKLRALVEPPDFMSSDAFKRYAVVQLTVPNTKDFVACYTYVGAQIRSLRQAYEKNKHFTARPWPGKCVDRHRWCVLDRWSFRAAPCFDGACCVRTAT